MIEFFNNNYVVEIFGGLILSLMGVLMIYILKPKVKIAPKITKLKTEDGWDYYIKVINRSYVFQLIDVHFELTLLKPVSSPRGPNLALKTIKLESDHVWFLSRRKYFPRKPNYATFAIVLKVDEDYDLVEKWNSENGIFLDLKVIAKNNFSGITGITHETYNHSSCVVEGHYYHGNSLEIEKNSKN